MSRITHQSVPFSTEVILEPQNPFIYIIGHSWVKHWLNHLGEFEPALLLRFNFVFFSFSNLKSLILNIDSIKSHPNPPSIIFCFIGGNNLYELPLEISSLKTDFLTLNRDLRKTFPCCKLVFSQIEERIYSRQNRFFRQLNASQFNFNSRRINNWLKVKITKGKLADKLFIIRNSLGLKFSHYARDGIHLNASGYAHLSSMLKNWLDKATVCINVPIGPPQFLVYCFCPSSCHNCNFLL